MRSRGSGGRRKVSEEILLAALHRHKGNRTKVAKEVGMADGTSVLYRIKSAPEGSAYAEFRDVKGKRGRKPKVSNETLADALHNHGGNQTKAAKEVGVVQSTVSRQISRAPKDSRLGKFKR